MSEDTNLFQPPPSYPEAPKNMYYQVPTKKPEPQKLSKLFPWESHAPRPTRVFAPERPVPTALYEEQPSPTQIKESALSPQTPLQGAIYEPSTESWDSYTRSNAWDEDPHIQKYMESMQKARRGGTQVIAGSSQSSTTHDSPPSSLSEHRPSIKLTDFPTEVERPSLPVTPAPIQRRGDKDIGSAETALPTAEGVPDQEDWVGVTVDAFSQILRVTYLFWLFTESPGPARRATPTAVRCLGESRAVAESNFSGADIHRA
jgi:glycogenin glucosyltransferase